MADAWGIWYTEAEPVEVVLRFHPRVARRVLETRWHRNEQTEEQPDGSLIWRAQVAEPQEMLPWIRGWGADVEVVGPPVLRDQMTGEARRLARVYHLGSTAPLDYSGGEEPMDVFDELPNACPFQVEKVPKWSECFVRFLMIVDTKDLGETCEDKAKFMLACSNFQMIARQLYHLCQMDYYG